MEMEELTFWKFLKELFSDRKISVGFCGLILSRLSDILGVISFIKQEYPSFANLIRYMPDVLLVGSLAFLIIGMYQYLGRRSQEIENYYKKGIFEELAVSDKAEEFFRVFNRDLLKKAIATLELKRRKSEIKFLGFARNNENEPQAILSIDGVGQEHTGAQIECRVKKEIHRGRKKFTVGSHFGYLEIESVDKDQNVAYCLMQKAGGDEWKDILSGVRKNRRRSFPDGIEFQLSTYDSFKDFSLPGLKNFYSLTKKFIRY